MFLSTKIRFFLLLIFGMLFAGCGSSPSLQIETPAFTWVPTLKIKMQEIRSAQGTSELIYQEVSDELSGLDTLVIASESHEESSLAGYVQKAINQLKIQGYTLEKEKTKKTEVKTKGGSLPAILKTYRVQHETDTLELAQLFVAQGATFRTISYASDEISHIKTFIKQLSSLLFSF